MAKLIKIVYNDREGENKLNFVQTVIDFSTNFISKGGFLFGFFIVLLESFIPILPLSVFVALNVNAFGFALGCLISWLATSIGSYCCYLIFYTIEDHLTEKFLKRKFVEKIHKTINKFKNISFTELVLLLTLPFTPSFFINALAGFSKLSKNKFLFACLIGKTFSIIFWGYIGKSFLESIMDIKSLIYISMALLLAYILSKIVSNKWDIE